VDLPNRLLPVLIALLALLAPANRRGIILAGGVISTLALASLQVAGGPQWLDAGLAPAYLSITAALLTSGLAIATLGGLLPPAVNAPDHWSRGRAGMTLGVIALGGYAVTLIAKAGGFLRSAGALASLVAIVAGLWLMLKYSGAFSYLQGWRARRGVRLAAETARPLDRADVWLLALHLVFVLLAVVGPHLVVLLVGVLGAPVSGLFLARRSGLRRVPWEMVAGVLLLLLVSGATIQVAGESSLRLSELPNGPFSPAFEPVAALGFILAAWPLLRLWPFHLGELGPVTPLAGATLIYRVAAPALPSGAEHWLPIVFPVLVLVTWYSAAAGDWAQATRALALAGIVSLRPTAVLAGGVLLGGESLLALAPVSAPPRIQQVGGAVVTVAGLWQLLPLLNGALPAQTFYTVLLAVSAALALAVSSPAIRRRPAR
jgi:hypothetical protein